MQTVQRARDTTTDAGLRSKPTAEADVRSDEAGVRVLCRLDGIPCSSSKVSRKQPTHMTNVPHTCRVSGCMDSAEG